MTRSKPESPSSRESGEEPDLPTAADRAKKSDEPEKKFDRASKLVVELEVDRAGDIGWGLFFLVLGTLMVWAFGTVGVWVGYALLAFGAWRAYKVVQTIVNRPGTIIVTEREVVLPRGLSMSKPVKAAPSDVTAVYFLRRSVPWNRSAPVLVVELGERALAFPRDWFANEADQRRIVHALLGVGAAGA